MFSVDTSESILRAKISIFPETVIILGSGWNKVLETATIELELPYQDIFGTTSSVPGHDGRLVIATIGKQRVACMAGRFHTYEGYTSEEVTRPIQVFAQLGMKQVIVTAAVGAINELYRVGDFVILSDMLTLLCPSPLTGPIFVDLSRVFDDGLRKRAREVCVKHDLHFHEGVYMFSRGPHFETPADKMMLHLMGADVVGMSTVPETIMARSVGVKVLGLSFVTNLAFVKHEHADVLAAAQKGSEQMIKILKEII